MSERTVETGPTGEDQGAEQPRIYVASLSDYNAGRLHGRWIDAARETGEVWADIESMLAASHEPGAEEWAIHDYEHFGPLRLSEYESVDLVTAIARRIVEHGDAFAAFASCLYQPDVEALDRFEESYRGRWDSVTDYADNLLDELGATEVLEQIPEWLQPYMTLDTEAYARDLGFSGTLLTIGSADGGVHVFEGVDG